MSFKGGTCTVDLHVVHIAAATLDLNTTGSDN